MRTSSAGHHVVVRDAPSFTSGAKKDRELRATVGPQRRRRRRQRKVGLTGEKLSSMGRDPGGGLALEDFLGEQIEVGRLFFTLWPVGPGTRLNGGSAQTAVILERRQTGQSDSCFQPMDCLTSVNRL